MTRQFSLAHLTALQCTPAQLIEVAAKAGYDFVSLRMTAVTSQEATYPLFRDRRMMGETKSRLTDTGLSVLDIELARMDPATEPEFYLPFLEAGAELGARAVITQLPDPDRSRATDRFATLCELAAPFRLNLDLEFPSWTETPDLAAAVAILQAVDKPNAGLLIDTLHFARSLSSQAELKKLPREWFHFIHLCDAPEEIPATTEELIHTARAARLFPGEGQLDLRAILDCLPEVPCSLEIPNEKIMRELGPEEFARRALAAAKNYLGLPRTGNPS